MSYEGMSDKGNEIIAFLESGASEGLSGAEVLRALRSEGLGYSTQTFYNDYRRVLAASEQFRGMRMISRDDVIRDEWYATSQEPLVAGRYQTVFEIKGTDLNTGRDFTDHVTVSHMELHERSVLEDAALSWNEDYRENVEIASIIPVKARRSAYITTRV